MSLESFLSIRYMSARRGRGLSVITWIALIGVVIGVMSLVTVLAVMSGFDKELRNKILGNNAHVLVQWDSQSDFDPKNFEKLKLLVAKDPDVLSVMPVIYGEAFILSPRGGAEGVFLKGVEPELVRKVLDLDQYVVLKSWDEFKDRGTILGEDLADQLKLSPGETFTLVLNRGDFSPLGMTPRMQRLTLTDTFKSGMTQFDAHHGFVTLKEAEKIFETQAKTLEIRTRDPRSIPDVVSRLRNAIDEPVSVTDWISWNRPLLSALKLEKMAMGVILGLIILVAAFNICGSLIMVVKDKTKDVAILKSMGATDGTVLKIFFYQGVFVGLVGTVVGIILGYICSALLRDYVRFPLDRSVYMIDTLPVDIRMTDILGVGFGALLISCLATLYPARMAASIIPTEGLKSE